MGDYFLVASMATTKYHLQGGEQGLLTGSRHDCSAGGRHEARVRHSPEVPHNRAVLSMHHDDAVQITPAAADQRENAALGSGHGLWRHCMVAYLITMMLQRDPGAECSVA